MDEKTKQLLERLTGAIEKSDAGNAAAKAASTPTVEAGAAAAAEIISKAQQAGAGGGESDAPVDDGASLQKSFETLAKSNRRFKHLDGNSAMDNPRGYLRAKDAKGDYIVRGIDLEDMLQLLLIKGREKAGIPIYEWVQKSGNPAATIGRLQDGVQKGVWGQNADVISRALDTTSGGPLMRVDLEPLLYEAYLRSFPALDSIRRIPSNGLVHTYDQVTAPGTASVIGELDDMSTAFSNNTYVRKQSTNIAIIIAPRAISLKLQYAVSQSGMGFALGGDSNLELVGAMRAMAQKKQALVLQGNQTVSSGAGISTENGAYDVNSHDGLRLLLKAAGTSITKGGGQTYTDVIDQAVAQIINAGGDQESVLIFASLGARRAFNAEHVSMLRLIESGLIDRLPNNFGANGLVTVSDWIARIQNIPAAAQADGLGYYTLSSVATEDMDVIDPNGLQIPYLGSPTPTILELPVGFNNQLSNVYYPFEMSGLCLRVAGFNRKIRIPQQTV